MTLLNRFFNIKSKGKTLDFGCGDGSVVREARDEGSLGVVRPLNRREDARAGRQTRLESQGGNPTGTDRNDFKEPTHALVGVLT